MKCKFCGATPEEQAEAHDNGIFCCTQALKVAERQAERDNSNHHSMSAQDQWAFDKARGGLDD